MPSIDAVGLVVFLAVMTGTPGPANMLLLGAAARHGTRAALTFFLGVTLGMQAVVWPAGLGLMELAARAPAVHHALRWTCALYIVWLAWRIAGSRIDARDDSAPPPGFARGLLVHPLNPKAWAIAAGAFTQFVDPAADTLTATAAVALATLLVGLLLQGMWFRAGGGLARLVAGRPMERGVMATLGVLTVASVFWSLR